MKRVVRLRRLGQSSPLAAFHVRVAAWGYSMIGFTVIFAAAISGYAGLGIWAIAVTAIALVSLSYAEYSGLYRRGQELGLTSLTQSTLLQSACNAAIATTGAYAAGLVLRMI